MFLVQMYVGEISSTKYRGSLLSFIHIFAFSGMTFVYILGQLVSLTKLNIICASIPLFFAIGFQLTPESVPYLISKRKYDKAERSLILLNKGDSEWHTNQIAEMRKKEENENAQKKSFSEILSDRATRKALFIMLLQFFFFQLYGINAVNFYSKTIFIEAGVNLNPGSSSIIYISFLTLSACVASFYAKKYGRRLMLCTFNIFGVISLFGIGFYFWTKERGYSTENLKWLPLASLCLFSISFTFGIGSVRKFINFLNSYLNFFTFSF